MDHQQFKSVFAYWTVKDTNNNNNNNNRSNNINQQQQQQQPQQQQESNVNVRVNVINYINTQPQQQQVNNNNNNNNSGYSNVISPTITTTTTPVNNNNNNVNNNNNNNNNTNNNSGYLNIPNENRVVGDDSSNGGSSSGYTLVNDNDQLQQQQQQQQQLLQQQRASTQIYSTLYSNPPTPRPLYNNETVSLLSRSDLSNSFRSSSYSVMYDCGIKPTSSSTSLDHLGNDSSSSTGTGGYSLYSDQNGSTSTTSTSSISQSASTTFEDEKEMMEEAEEEKNKLMEKNRDIQDKGRDWNMEFQNLLRLPSSLDKFQKLTFMAMDFVRAAEHYGFIIIKEMFMPLHLKTIKPIDIGGIAGGEKYICQNILFKFAYDQKIGDQWLYGGKYPSDFGASKAAGNELRGLSCFFQNIMDNDLGDKVNVPLMCVIDYYGYRLVAISLLPITKSSIIYGSCDGGNVVHDDVPEVNEIMERVGEVMKLKKHLSGHNPTAVYGPGDFEIHRSEKGEYYAIDFARLFPPQAYFDNDGNAIAHRDVFYKLLRPEFLKAYDKPLSSDAFTGWGVADPDNDRHNNEIIEATTYLYDIVIPKAAREFEDLWKNGQPTTWDITTEVHRCGISMRHLGKLRNRTTHPDLRKNILNEMVARILKSQIKEELRIHLSGHFIGSEEKCIQTIVDFLNRVFNIFRFDVDKGYWTITIKSLFMNKYGALGCGLSEDELDSKFDLSKVISMVDVMAKFQQKTGIKLSNRIKKSLMDSKNAVRPRLPMVLYTDIKDVRPVAKHSNMISRSEGISLYMKALEMIYANQVYYDRPVKEADYARFSDDYSEELSLLETCRIKLLQASRSSTTDASLYHLLGLVDLENFKLKRDHSHLRTALKSLNTSLSFGVTPTSIITLATVNTLLGDFKMACNTYRRLSQFDPQVVVPLLFDSASMGAPYYKVGVEHSIDHVLVAFQQIISLYEIFKTLPEKHALIEAYRQHLDRIAIVTFLRGVSINTHDYHRGAIAILEAHLSIKLEFKELNREIGKMVDEILERNENILNEHMVNSKNFHNIPIPFLSYLIVAQHSPRLCEKVKQFFAVNPLSTFHAEVITKIYNDQQILTYLFMYSPEIQFDSLLLRYKDFDYNRFSEQKNLVSLRFFNIYMTQEMADAIFDNLPHGVIQNLVFESMNLNTTILLSDKHRPVFSKVKSLQLLSLSASAVQVIQLLLDASKESVEYLKIDYNITDFSKSLRAMTNVKELSISSYDYPLQDLPPNIETLSVSSEVAYDKSANSSPSAQLMSVCPKIKHLTLQCDTLLKDLDTLRNYPLESLDINGYQYLNDNKLYVEKESSPWPTSLTSLRIYYAMKAGGPFDKLIAPLKGLKKLDLSTNYIVDEEVEKILKELTNLEELKISSSNYKLLCSSPVIARSIKTLTLAMATFTPENYSYVGATFPYIEQLSIENPRSLSDLTFSKLIDGLTTPLKSLTLDTCFEISDSAVISICSSKSSQTLEKIRIRDCPKFQDVCFVKMADSLPNLTTIQYSPSLLRRHQTNIYILKKYPTIKLDSI